MATKRVADLGTGDILLPTYTEVLSHPVAGLRTPKGKVEVTVKYSSGIVRTQLWNRNTKVTVKD